MKLNIRDVLTRSKDYGEAKDCEVILSGGGKPSSSIDEEKAKNVMRWIDMMAVR